MKVGALVWSRMCSVMCAVSIAVEMRDCREKMCKREVRISQIFYASIVVSGKRCAVVGAGCLEFMQDKDKAVSEPNRVTREGGGHTNVALETSVASGNANNTMGQ